MQVGDQVKVTAGRDAGTVGRISRVYPGKQYGEWPYYFQVRLNSKRTIQAVKGRLEPYTPDEPLGNYWERPDPLGL